MFKVREGGILTGEYALLQGIATTANGASADSIQIIGVVPYSLWRVVAVGFAVASDGASTVAEKVHFGILVSDIGATDDDYFGIFTQDATINKQMVAGDMFQNPAHTKLKTPDAAANAGAHAWSVGAADGINVWQSKQALITITKKQVASSTAVVNGWVLIEIGA